MIREAIYTKIVTFWQFMFSKLVFAQNVEFERNATKAPSSLNVQT